LEFLQTYILNEDFSSASVTVRDGWYNSAVTGQVYDLWHFDNYKRKLNLEQKRQIIQKLLKNFYNNK